MYFLSAFLSVLRISIAEHFIVVALMYIAAVPEWLHVGDAVLGGEQADIPTPCYTHPPTHTYLIFVIFFTRLKFLENKIYTEKRQFFALNL